MRAAWATDTHLRFCDDAERQAFYREMAEDAFDVLLLTGDIGGESDLAGSPEPLDDCLTLQHLRELEEGLGRPIYFVLGNHDYFRSSIATIRAAVGELCRPSRLLHFVQEEGILGLTERTAVVGHECWGDAGWGDFYSSEVMMNDWKVVWELKHYWQGVADPTRDLMSWKLSKHDLHVSALRERLQTLGEEAAEHLGRVLPEALNHYARVILLTHVPPFVLNYPSKWRHPEDYLPVAVCRAAGETILEIAQRFPHRQIQVLSGHIHHRQAFRVAENLTMAIGHAELMAPRIETVLEVE